MRSLFDAPAISVGELCRRIRTALRGQFPASVRVLGEISKCRTIEGNTYFTLKDREGLIDCYCFRDTASQLHVKLPLEDGSAVEVAGFVDIYERKSAYQLRVTDIIPVGKGALYLAFEQLKAKLDREGLFAAARKRPIPRFIRDVAIVTSRNAAALQDFLTTCRRRGAHVRVWLLHTPVQGPSSAPELARAIVAAGRLRVDVVVVARGGGSIDDLWAFNTEQVARAIARCAKPVISAIGHETDVTIADFVADKRAPTPTAAAEFVAQEREMLLGRITSAQVRLQRALLRWIAAPRLHFDRVRLGLQRAAEGALSARAQRIDDLASLLGRGDPRRRIALWQDRTQDASERLRVLGSRGVAQRAREAAALSRRLSEAFSQSAAQRERRLDVAAATLHALAPRRTLQRGYAIAYDANGAVLTDSAAVRLGERIGVELKTGWLGALVSEKKDEYGKNGREKDGRD
ncbi:MAG: exodeoxyribonuclease VII large subunit [Candidatus Eremiobacteraeota bacterium]|nr:exodeoxyribonuclease VII large subunit [Candidatus Eremiobacteraeota bacterium]